ncbi:MAG: geranylgeranylglycerol-phosphate geranylgeranyltransferase [Sediminibacterium sp.]|nr:geranylgeranylglycerol-phosphate geranylgeranyltransferase [Chitinophagaceae bacterium]
MKLLSAFLRLIRFPNLIFIIITQLLFEWCIYERIYPSDNTIERSQLLFLIAASVCIAAGGYIINDYFDQNIDQINKPSKVVVNRVIKRRWVMFWHLFLSLAGIFFTNLALPLVDFWHLILANMIAIIALWVYSTDLKKKLLVGNLLISLLTAWVIGILFFSKYPLHIQHLISVKHAEVRFFRLAALYAGFAFVISLVREVVKDMEDIEGDRKYGCTTMPIVWGLRVSKVFVAVWIVVLIGVLVVLQLYALGMGWWHSAVYCTVFIIIPLMYVLRKLFSATTPTHFHHLSSWVKFIMLTGILSMLFFRFYH